MQRYLLFMVLGIVLGSSAFAQKQGQSLIDSLIIAIPNAKNDTAKAKLLYAISFRYNSIDPNKGVAYGSQAIAFARKMQWKKGIAQSYNSRGTNYWAMSNYSLAIDDLLKALQFHQEANNKVGIGQVLANLGLLHHSQKNYRKALEYYTRSVAAAKEALLPDAENAITYTNMSDAYRNMSMYDSAFYYQNVALRYYQKDADSLGLARSYINIALIFKEKANYPDALRDLFKALNISNAVDISSCWTICLSNLGATYLKLAKEQPEILVDSIVPAGKKAKLERALYYLQRATMSSYAETDIDLLHSTLENLSEVEAMNGNYSKALQTYKASVKLKDSVFSQENKQKLDNYEAQLKLDQKDKQIKVANLTISKKRNERAFLVSGIVLLILVVLIVYRERRKSDKLLLNILPFEVAADLKSRGATTAKQFDKVTVLFTDFVNFTGAGERMGTEKLVDELHNCFKAFDAITDKYNIEKIKTIGDAYLAVCGLPLANERHAENVVKAAIEIKAFMQDRNAKMGDNTFEIRIGVHSGSVMAGIVGVRKFAYDIWGDTVNTAARMEQNSVAGKINISETTYELVKDKFSCVYRGEIDAKNKGKLKMYFVERGKD